MDSYRRYNKMSRGGRELAARHRNNMIEVGDKFYDRVCDRVGLEMVDEGHISDDDNDSWHLVSNKKDPSVNGNMQATGDEYHLD